MDPTTTLFTFMLQTDPSVKVVHLIGSWDNFTRTYVMERDSRRAPGQWRGCYTFKDIICDGDAESIPKRNGGLKMGHTYYYYYELDGASETHDPSQPSTTTCPYLPGQTVNTLCLPIEQSGRKRSASLTSLREEDFKTMDPASKFVAPRPAPSPPAPARRIGTAPLRMQQPKRPSRSPSPGSSWIFSPRKLFSRKSSSLSLRDTSSQVTRPDDERSLRSEGSRSRDISPESLRRFLVDDAPLDHEHDDSSNRPAIDIPDDIVEENEDDDNFATSAVSESMPFTGLSPPPPRTFSPSPATTTLLSTPVAASPIPTGSYLTIPVPPTRPPPRAPTLQTAPDPDVHSQPAFSVPAPLSPDSPTLPVPGLHHSEDDDEEEEEEEYDEVVDEIEERVDTGTDTDNDRPPTAVCDADGDNDEVTSAGAGGENGPVSLLPKTSATAPGPSPSPSPSRSSNAERNPFARNLAATLSTYSLPRTAGGAGAEEKLGGLDGAAAASLVSACPIPDGGLGELVSELGWLLG